VFTVNSLLAMREARVEDFQFEAVLSGIEEVLAIVGVREQIEMRNLGVWREDGWREELPDGSKKILPYRSVDWYVVKARVQSIRRPQLEANILVGDWAGRPQAAKEQWGLFVLHGGMCVVGETAEEPIVLNGVGHPGYGVIVLSVSRFLGLDCELQAECLKTLAMHETGHMFGLVPEGRWMPRYRHCGNVCVMRRALDVRRLVIMTRDRLNHEPYCCDCRAHLQTASQAP
jgi:hypothetical protein